MYDELIINLRNYAEVYKLTDNENTLEYSLLIKAADAIEKLSKERKKGEWLHKEITDDFHVVGQCSVCKERRRVDNFCPSCGADMR